MVFGGGRRTGAILSSEVLLDGHKGGGHTNSLSHRASIKSSPETEGGLGRSPGWLDVPCVESGLAGKSGRVRSLCGLALHLGNTASSKQRLLSPFSSVGGSQRAGCGRDAGNRKSCVTDWPEPSPWSVTSTTLFLSLNHLSRACLCFLEKKYTCMYL